jgi:hypothetical protein
MPHALNGASRNTAHLTNWLEDLKRDLFVLSLAEKSHYYNTLGR